MDVPSPRGPLRRPVVGVVPDYASDRGAIVISRDLYRTHWNDTLVNYFMLTLADGATAADVRRDMQQAVGERGGLSVMEIAALRTSVDAIVREAFADMDAIQFLVLVIALAGILDLLVTNTLDRTRELAIWRFLGAVDRAVVRSLVWEALAMAAAAVVFRLIVGVVLAWVWIRFSYPALVGYVLQFHFPWATSLLCVGLALGVAAVSGRLAAIIAVRHPILEGLLHE